MGIEVVNSSNQLRVIDVTPANIAGVYRVIKQQLQAIVDLEIAQQEAWFLLEDLLAKPISLLRMNQHLLLSKRQLLQLQQWLDKRLAGMPLTHVTGVACFWDYRFKVNQYVLAPRADSEILIEQAINLIQNKAAWQQRINLLDLGTGSGALIISLLKEVEKMYPQCKITATAVDYSEPAILVAKENYQLIRPKHQINFVHSNWFQCLDQQQKFDLIISNPPYLSEKDPHLTELLPYEPASALIASKQGLADLQCIIAQGRYFLQDGGVLIIEHGYQQGEQVEQLFMANNYLVVQRHNDYAGHWRSTSAQHKDSLEIKTK